MALALGYFLGAIPFGLVLTKAAGLGDVREIGSKSIGATNVLRTGSKGLAAATLLLDTLKGTAAVFLGAYLGTKVAPAGAWWPAHVAGLGAFLGHLYPIWLKFKGGKGVATFIGVLLGLHWPVMLAFGGVWLATAAITRYSSLSALVATLAVTVLSFVLEAPQPLFMLAMGALIFARHQANIGRLLSGTESRIGDKAKA
ncbi:MAG: glycerol-3-phosphate 1-O-acyltransferase PlsY [Hyphomicrobiaceae bacterium]|nr:MAG: glycerol-3-phosphate 1-O-acyltransferase PlsY [Hyphomicrobiaceae bacterium]